MNAEEAWSILNGAELIWPQAAVEEALDCVAARITAELGRLEPLVLSVMGGAVVFTGHLLPRLRFPLDFDYVHVTRYTGTTSGGTLRWIATPRSPVRDRVVLLVDDILDEGVTLAAIKDKVLELGARACLAAVLVDKDLGHRKPVSADFVGLRVPDRYVFGFGMDVRGAWRNLPAIYAVGESRPG
ncbi:MAG: hypoxanthine-guanine phosphoribosyltransferase [Rhodocyclales bacterium CG17_big_fil_post_rev_8_21_14_2_50_68_7]|nr:MAG: hypoxanthine-guanine phosphoribosyltransferase [Betaproteobacteria bacterium CG2_30_68_42]PIV74515.1 MAG: hypoxanthine-guanine phosphoribosyltransferase [Rhodocyclales bacterium CG17_big_fil_post_rev_8_21_14_2_50_68_7]PIX75514.1 MAG: hypoxanthine-guanine phosphoribosyltransferase [Rhodocyclales bacterium CG_4_10_14_3_um_filter_68_10]